MVMYYKSFAISGGIVLALVLYLLLELFCTYNYGFNHYWYFLFNSNFTYWIYWAYWNKLKKFNTDYWFFKTISRRKNMSINEAIARATATRSKPIILTVLQWFCKCFNSKWCSIWRTWSCTNWGTLISYVFYVFVPVIIKNQLKKRFYKPWKDNNLYIKIDTIPLK